MALQDFATVNASLLLPGRVKLLENNSNRALQGVSQSAVGTNRLEPGLEESSWKQCNHAPCWRLREPQLVFRRATPLPAVVMLL